MTTQTFIIYKKSDKFHFRKYNSSNSISNTGNILLNHINTKEDLENLFNRKQNINNISISTNDNTSIQTEYKNSNIEYVSLPNLNLEFFKNQVKYLTGKQIKLKISDKINNNDCHKYIFMDDNKWYFNNAKISEILIPLNIITNITNKIDAIYSKYITNEDETLNVKKLTKKDINMIKNTISIVEKNSQYNTAIYAHLQHHYNSVFDKIIEEERIIYQSNVLQKNLGKLTKRSIINKI